LASGTCSVERDADRLHHLELGLAVARARRRLQLAAGEGQAGRRGLTGAPAYLPACAQQELAAVGERVEGRVGDEQDVAQLLEDACPGAPAFQAAADAGLVAQDLVAGDDDLEYRAEGSML
jgi:hypothetical protein